MIDLHTHILPGMDDGAKDLGASFDMARTALRDGVATVLATPHSVALEATCGREKIEQRVSELAAALREQELDLDVLAGVEALLTPDLLRWFEGGRLGTLNGSRYILVELPYEVYPSYTEQVLFELQLHGLVPIIAHPERNDRLQRDPGQLHNLAERGILSQVTASSLIGSFGSRARQTARLFVKHNLAQFIASDAHTAWGSRSPVLSRAVAEAATLVGAERAMAMVNSAPRAVVEDKVIVWEDPLPLERERRWWWFWR